jgi:hypothetical protein
MIQYCCYEIRDFELLQSKLDDLEKNEWNIDVTPFANNEGIITTYFVFCKKLKSKEKKASPIKDLNSELKLTSFYKK